MHVLRTLVLCGTPEQRALLAGAGVRVVRLDEALLLVPVTSSVLRRNHSQAARRARDRAGCIP